MKHVGGKCCINHPTRRWRQQSDTLSIYQSIRCHILEDLNLKDLHIVISEKNGKQGARKCTPHAQWRNQEFCSEGGSTNSVEDTGQRERGSGGGSPLVRGSGGSCNLVQEISFHILKFS